MNILVKDFMVKSVIVINPFKSVESAELLMSKNKIGGIPVVENNVLLGIVTSQDIRRSHPNRLVIDAMSKNLICLNEKKNLLDAKKKLEENNIERLPITSKEGVLVGIITKTDIYKELGKYYDALTGLPSSELLVSNLMDGSFYNNNEITVLFFDIDNFGEFNKNFGHIIGDQALLAVSTIIKQNIKDEYICRYGGDEFTAILFVSFEFAKKIIDQIFFQIAEHPFLAKLAVSISVGVAGSRINTLSKKEELLVDEIKSLINSASLASTKAKSLREHYSVAE